MRETKMFSIKKRGGGETIMVHKDYVDEFQKSPFELIAPFLLRCNKCGAEIETGFLSVATHWGECHTSKIPFSVTPSV